VASEWKIKVYRVIKPFWRRIFSSFNHCKNMMIGALSSEFCIQIVDLKQLPGLRKTKMVMYSITSKLNSTFGMISKAMTDKLSQK